MANSGSTWASVTQWNAESHTAYQGYSHLSGMEMTSTLSMWRQWALRPCLRCVRRRRAGGVAVEPVGDVVVVELLRPEHPGEGLAHDERLVGGGVGRA